MNAGKIMILVTVTCFSLLVLSGCSTKAEKIVPGKDNCTECKMTIMDPHFGAEIVTKKGKVYKFDDTHCIASFLKRRGVALGSISKTLFVNYNKPEEFVEVGSAEFVVSSKLNAPMGGAAAFPNKMEAEKKSSEIDGSRVTNWATLYNILVK